MTNRVIHNHTTGTVGVLNYRSLRFFLPGTAKAGRPLGDVWG